MDNNGVDKPSRVVRVTAAQKLAAQVLIERSKTTGRILSPAVYMIANASPNGAHRAAS